MVSRLGEVPYVDAKMITVVDNRLPEAKQAKRDSVMSPIARMSEEEVSPSALIFLQNYLQMNQKQKTHLKLEVSEFHVIDYFPARMNSVMRSDGWLVEWISLNAVRKATDWSFVKTIGLPERTDCIVILFTGKVNGKEVKVASYVPYQISPFAGSVRNTSGFTEAVKLNLEKTAKEILEEVEI